MEFFNNDFVHLQEARVIEEKREPEPAVEPVVVPEQPKNEEPRKPEPSQRPAPSPQIEHATSSKNVPITVPEPARSSHVEPTAPSQNNVVYPIPPNLFAMPNDGQSLQRMEEAKYTQSVMTEDERNTFRKVTSYYGNQYSNEKNDKFAAEKYLRYPIDDKMTKEKCNVDINAKSYVNQIGNANVPFSSFGPPMGGPLMMGPEKAVNLSDGRGYGMPNVHELGPTGPMYVAKDSMYMPKDLEEKYSKSKRLKSTSPVKMKEREHAMPKNNAMTHESQARKFHERDERFYKESNLEQSLMKVKKMAQMEEESKYKERKCSKSPIAGKEKKVTRSPSYSMDSVEMAKNQEEIKYKAMRRENEEHVATISNVDSGQHFVGGAMMKQPIPSPHGDSRSMGVYTPDSTTNSVHSVHGYGQYDMDSGHLNIESPNSISSNDMNTTGEPTRPPSTTLPTMHSMYIDSQQQATMLALHHLQQQHPIHALPQLQPAPMSSHVKSQSSRKNASNVNHHHHHRNKSVNQQHMNSNTLHRSTPPSVGNPHSPINSFIVNTTTNNSSAITHRSTPPTVNHQPSQSRHHQIPTYSHTHHPVITQSGYLGVSQMPAGSYPPVPVTTVIQHRMTASEPPQTQQRLVSSPCSTSSPTGYFMQHMHSTTPSSPSPSSGPCTGRMQNSQAAVNACSLAKLQQLTNGLDVLPPSHCGTMNPSSPINLTPPPPSSHGNMTTPPVAHQMLQQSNYKFLGNIPSSSAPVPCTTPSGTSSSNRSSRGSHHASVTTSRTGGMSPNVTINPNLMTRYSGSPYGYQMPGQPAPSAQLGYIANGAPGFINQTQLPVRMGVVNVAQNQYGQDPTQNSMYSPAAYYSSFIR